MFLLLSAGIDEREELQLYAAYRELRIMAKRDSRGEIDPEDRRWIHFDYIKTWER